MNLLDQQPHDLADSPHQPGGIADVIGLQQLGRRRQLMQDLLEP